MAKEVIAGIRKTRKLCALVALDAKNTLNSAEVREIISPCDYIQIQNVLLKICICSLIKAGEKSIKG